MSSNAARMHRRTRSLHCPTHVWHGSTGVHKYRVCAPALARSRPSPTHLIPFTHLACATVVHFPHLGGTLETHSSGTRAPTQPLSRVRGYLFPSCMRARARNSASAAPRVLARACAAAGAPGWRPAPIRRRLARPPCARQPWWRFMAAAPAALPRCAMPTSGRCRRRDIALLARRFGATLWRPGAEPGPRARPGARRTPLLRR